MRSAVWTVYFYIPPRVIFKQLPHPYKPSKPDFFGLFTLSEYFHPRITYHLVRIFNLIIFPILPYHLPMHQTRLFTLLLLLGMHYVCVPRTHCGVIVPPTPHPPTCVHSPHLLVLHQRIHLIQKTIQTCLRPMSITPCLHPYYVEDHFLYPYLHGLHQRIIITQKVYTKESVLRRRPFKHAYFLCPYLLGLQNPSYVEDHSNMHASCIHTSLVYTKQYLLRRTPFKHACVCIHSSLV